jgi:hypothetical protein
MAAQPLLDEIMAAIDAGDAERVLELIASTAEPARKRLAPKLRAKQEALRRPHLLDPRHAPSPQRVAAVTACVATGTPQSIARLFEPLADPAALDLDLAARAAEARGHEFAAELVNRLLDLGVRAAGLQGRAWTFLRRLIRDGAAEPPQDPRYIAMMISCMSRVSWRDPDRIYRALIEDPALLEDEVWRLFEIDVVAELDEQRVWGGPKTPRASLENAWIRGLVRHAAEGRLDRARLLDASLTALGRDFRASKIGWHGGLHEALRPTAQERADRLTRYASLLSSPTPSVVRVGLIALSEIEERVPVDLLVRAAPGPLSLREKKYAIQMLRMLDRALARESVAAGELLRAATHGLAHTRTDVQERTLELLERHSGTVHGSVEVRSAILGVAESVAPSLRARLDYLLGFSTRGPKPETDQDMSLPAPIAPRAATQPISGIDELVEVAALVLEGDAPAEALDRFLDALPTHPATPDVTRTSAAVLKRARAVLSAPRWPGVSSAQIAAAALCGWADGETKPVAPPNPGGDAPPPPLTPRIDYYMDWRNAWLRDNPEATAALRAMLARPDRGRLALSTRRLTDDDLRAAGVPDPEAARRAAGDPVLVFDPAPGDADPAAQWLRDLNTRPGARGYKRELLWAADRGGARWLMSRHPGRTDVFFAIAATNAYLFRDDNIVYGFGDVVLERALDPQVELGTAAWFAVGSALMVKAADVRRLAGDVVAAAIADGRFDPPGLADAMAFLTREGAGNLRRVTDTFADISRLSGTHGAQLLRLTEALLPHIEPASAGLHHPLELALELATDLDLAVADGDARAALARVVEQMSRTAKASRAAQRLLDRPAKAN